MPAIISRINKVFKRSHSAKSDPNGHSINEKAVFTPPPGPPPGYPHLVQFPGVSPADITTLFSQGYARVDPPSELLAAASDLFATSRAFFASEPEHKKQFHLSVLGEAKGQSSEEGWSRVEGEKEMITIRRKPRPESDAKSLCPPEVTQNVEALWHQCGNFMKDMMASVELSLELPKRALSRYYEPECELPFEQRHETLLRMFRYERSDKARLVAEQHKDIGLLSLVIGSSPGLDVWDQRTNRWIAIEEADGKESDTKSEPQLTFTVLAGQTLRILTNERYRPGVHRVFVPPAHSASSDDESKYRYSLVFALRPYRDASVSTKELITPITGHFGEEIEGMKVQKLFNTIANAHWSVNGGIQEREEQREKLRKLKEAQANQVAVTQEQAVFVKVADKVV